MSSKYEGYVHDLGFIIRDLALEAKKNRDNVSSIENADYENGYLMGFHRFVSLMQQMADAMDIPLEEIGLDGIDPNEELL